LAGLAGREGINYMGNVQKLELNRKKMTHIKINKEPVELFKILKFEGVVASGGEAKAVIADGQVKVNGAVETQKRKKIVDGDNIEFMEQEYQIVLE
jgi:ribosome-associated protein